VLFVKLSRKKYNIAMNYPYKIIGVSGTFDHLHKGHEKILKKALGSAEKIICGLMSQNAINYKILPQTIQSYLERQTTLNNFFSSQDATSRVKIVKLNDIFGPTLGRTEIEALVVSKEKESAVDFINLQRTEHKLPVLQKIIISMALAQDLKPLSSSRIRLGQIDRDGFVYAGIFEKNLALPENLRKNLKQPLGQLLHANEIKNQPAPFIAIVGDVITDFFNKSRLNFSLAVVDYKNKRIPLPNNYHYELFNNFFDYGEFVNDPGTVSQKFVKYLITILKHAILINKKGVIRIIGEEDLVVLPLIMLSPLKSLIYYGQPDQGAVKIEVTEQKKQKVQKILENFTQLK
jgi:pantetheine-phosphate adenylyltransferase